MSPKKLCIECEFRNRPYSEYPCNCCTKNQKKGHWIMQGLSPYEGFIRCSECGAVYDIKRVFKYCPNCGAKMEDQE